MASSKIFIGNIMKEQVEALTSMESSLSNMTDSLLTLGENTSQSIDELKIISDTSEDAIRVYAPLSSKSIEGTVMAKKGDDYEYKKICQIKSIGIGTIAFNVENVNIKADNERGLNVRFVVKVNGDIKAQSSNFVFDATGGIGQAEIEDIYVGINDIVEFGINVTSNHKDYIGRIILTCPVNAVNVSYKLRDVVSSGLIPME